MTESGYRSPMNATQRLHAASRVRRWLGAADIDALLGARREDEATELLLVNTPAVTPDSVEDGWDLLEFERVARPESSVGRWGRWCGWVGGLAVIVAFVGLAAGLVVGVVGTEHDDAFEALPGMLGGLLLPVLGVLGGAGILLVFVAWLLGSVARVLDARAVVRWAAARPGQAQRGLPTQEPISPLRGWFVAVSIISWGVGGIVGIFGIWLLGEGDFAVWGLLVTAAALCLVGYLSARAGRAIARAAAVADKHLFVLDKRERGLPLDVATSVAESVLVVSDPVVVTYSAEEFTAYPLTSRLPEEDLRTRHTIGAVDGHTEVISRPGVGPLVTRETTDHERHHDDHHWQREYAEGWLVATGRTLDFGRPAWLMVRERPERFAEEVLPLFEGELGLERGSVTLVPPERLPEGTHWLRDWVKARG